MSLIEIISKVSLIDLSLLNMDSHDSNENVLFISNISLGGNTDVKESLEPYLKRAGGNSRNSGESM